MIMLDNHCVANFLAKILIWAPFSQSVCTLTFLNACFLVELDHF